MTFSRHTLGVAVLVSLLAFLADTWIGQPPTVKPAPVPAGQFSADRAFGLLEQILSDRVPHPIGTDANKRVRARITKFLEDEGIAYEIQSAWGCAHGFNRCGWVENIIGIVPGEREGPYVAMMSHYDSVPMAPGAGDDGAGTAAVLETARILVSEGAHRNPLLIVITDGEEMGLLGAEAFFARHRLAKEIGVITNIEGAGTTGVSTVLRVAGDNAGLIGLYRALADYPAANSLIDEIFKRMPNDTDFSVSIRAGVPGIDFASAGEFTHYHTPNDNLDNLDKRTLQHDGENLLPLMRGLLSSNLAEVTQAQGNLVFLQFYSVWVAWPVWFNWVLLVISAAALAGFAMTRLNGWKVPLLAVGGSVLVFVAVGLVGVGAFKIVEVLAGTIVSWPAVLWPYRLLLLSAPILGGLAVALAVNRKTPVEAALFGAWIPWLVLGALVAVVMPGATGGILAPLTIAVLLIVAASRTQNAVLATLLLVAAFIPVISTTLSLAFALEESQGYRQVSVTFPFTALFVVALAPLVRGRQGVILVGLLVGCTLVGLVGVATAPLYSSWRPQHVNIQFVEDTDAHKAWYFLSASNPDPPHMREVLDFSLNNVAMFPWSDWEVDGVAIAEVSGQAAPDLQITSDSVVEGGVRSVDMILQAKRPVLEMRLLLPKSSGLQKILLEGVELEPGTLDWPLYKDHFLISLVGMNDRPVRLTLELGSPDAVDAWLVDSSTQLPDSASKLVATRPPLASPVHQGDSASLVRRIRF